MKIVVDLVGLLDHTRTLEWPEGWAIPHEGDPVYLPGVGRVMYVRTISWHPEGGDGEVDSFDDNEPYVYLVIGTTRKGETFRNLG